MIIGSAFHAVALLHFLHAVTLAQQKTESSYHSDKASAIRRLKIQFQYSEESDRESFLYALQRIGNKEHLYGLDVSCADGYVTESRFRAEYGFELVVDIDHNEKMIARQSDHDYFRYRHTNVESPDIYFMVLTISAIAIR